MKDAGGLGASWEDEEERKRREREAREQQRLGIAGAPLRIEGKPVQYTTPAQPDRDLARKRRVDEELSPYFAEVAQSAGKRLASKDGNATGILGEYFALRNKVGEETLLSRFNNVAALADKYLSDYDTAGLVWDMVRSPYNDDQIEYMLRKGSEAMYDPSWRRADVPPVSAFLLKSMGIDPNDQVMGDEVGQMLRETGGYGLIARGSPKFANARSPVEQMYSTLADVGRASAWLGEKIGSVLEHYSPEAAADREIDEIAKNRAKSKGIDERFARGTTPGYAEFERFVANAHNVPTADFTAMQIAIQKDEKDEDGNIIREGYGKDLEAEGIMTREWRNAFEKDWRRRNSEVVAMQRMLTVNGYAEGLDIDGNIQTPEWQKAIATYTQQVAKNAEWFQRDPEGFMTSQMIGTPSTTGGWQAWANRHLAHGVPQFFYGSGVTAAKAISGGVAALFAQADLNARAQNNPSTMAVVEDAWSYLQTQLSEEDQKKFMLFGRMSDKRKEVVKSLESLAESDPVAKQKLDAVNVEMGMLVTERFRPNIYTTVGHMLGVPYGEVERSYQNNVDRAEGINFLAEIVGSAGFGAASKASRVIRPLERTEVALLSSARATRIVDSTLEYIKGKELYRAAGELQGGDAPTVVKRIDDVVAGRGTAVARDTWQELSASIEQAVKANDTAAVQAVLPHIKDAQGFLDDIRTRAGKELVKPTKPKKIALDKPPAKKLATEIADLVNTPDYSSTLKRGTRLGNALKKPTSIDGLIKAIENDVVSGTARGKVLADLVQRVEDLGYDSSTLRKRFGMPPVKPPDHIGAVSKALRARQRANGDIFTLEDFGKRTIYDAWTGSAGKQALDVMTRLEAPRIGNPGRAWRALDTVMDSNLTPGASKLYYALTKPVRGAPLPEVELWRPDTAKRIWDYAFQVSSDASFANTIANRYIRAAATEDLIAVKRIGDQLVGKANDRFVLKGGVTIDDGIDPRLARMAEADPEAFRLLNENTLAIHPKTGESIGGFKTNDGIHITPPQDTIYQMNKLKLGREFMWAERKLPTDAEGFARTSVWLQKNIENRLWRRTGRFATKTNATLRSWTVGARPQLFFKHAIVDTARSFVNDWQSVLRPVSNHKKFTKWIESLDADAANYVRAERHRGHVGELLYNMGQRYRRFKSERVWDMDAKGFFPRNMNKAADAYRRMASGDAYRAYATNGEAGVRTFLATPKGLQFLKEGGHLKRAAEELDQIDIAPKHKRPSVTEKAIDDYVEFYVRGIMEGLDEAAPDIADALKAMARNERPLTSKAIKEEIKRVGPDQNPYLSIEERGSILDEANPTVAIARRMAGVWMTPNKMNRDVTFNRMFNVTMDKLTKEGIDPNSASAIAAHVARATTERVHFDLANALYVEQKHRWYAWFATKHRLYATYLARMAVENPMLTLPITTIVDWMEERNAKDNVQEWDKQKLRLSVFGKEVEVNLHILTWLVETSLQSGFGHLADLGVAVVAGRVGYDMKWDPGSFGVSFGAQQNFVLTMASIVQSPLVTQLVPGVADLDEARLDDWLQGLSATEQESWNRSINLEMAEARLLHDEEIDPVEAYKRAAYRTLKHEFYMAFRPFPGSIVGEGSKERDAIMQRYMKASPKQRARMLDNEPALRYMFGLEDDSVKLFHLDEALGEFNELQDTYSQQVLEGHRSGKLMDDKNEWARISAEYNRDVEALKRKSPHFAEYMAEQPDADFGERMQLTWPLVDIPRITEESRPKSAAEKTLYKQGLTDAFTAKLEEYGMGSGDGQHPFYKRLKEDMVERPMRDYTGYDEFDPTWKEVTIARYMARGGATGIASANSYMRIVKSKERVEYMQAGLDSGRPVGSRPWMAMLSTEQKARMGWNSSRAQEDRWKMWSETKASLEYQMAELKINSASKEGKAFLSKRLEALAESWKAEDPDWYREWQVSQLSLVDRMKAFGFGDGDKPIDHAWAAFIDTMDDMHGDMAANKLKTLEGKKAGPIADLYLARILELKEEYPEWWRGFRYNFTMSDFGFGKWRLPDGRSDVLFNSEVE